MEENVIVLEDICKIYKMYNSKTDRAKEALSIRKKKHHKEFYALKNINLSIEKGQILGIIGKNGSGKSTLLKIISGILTPTRGNINTRGKIIPLLELGSGFNPEYSGIDNIFFYNSFFGISKKKTKKVLDEIIEFADIGDHLYQPL